MKSRIEDELREHFENSASGFDMDPSLPRSVKRRAKRRAVRTTSALVAIAVVVAAGSVAALRVHHGDSTPPVVAAHTGTTVLKLVDYVPQGDEGPDDPAFDQALQQHVDCMRDQGFDVPDPIRTEHGWSIIMSPGSDPLSDPRWREAALVTCAIDKFSHRPLTGDLILGFSKAKIDEFMSCMRSQGYDLPEPTLAADGNYRWSLEGLGIDTSTDGWRRAVFVTCSPTDN